MPPGQPAARGSDARAGPGIPSGQSGSRCAAAERDRGQRLVGGYRREGGR